MTGFYWANVKVPEFLAQPADLATYMNLPDVSGLPANATGILRATTSQVIRATTGAFYDADPATGLPLVTTDDETGEPDSTTLDAMVRATCIQALAWIRLGLDPDLGGAYVPSVKTSAKIGTASVQRAAEDSAAAVAARQAALDGLVPQAWAVLQQHNLVGNGPWTFG